VTDWVRVPKKAAYYDDGTVANGWPTPSRNWLFLRDSVNGWYNVQIAAGKTPAQIDAYLSQFDTMTRITRQEV